MIRLGDLPLPDDLVRTDRLAWSSERRAFTLTVAGTLVVSEAAGLFRPITPVARSDQGWLSDDQAETLRTMSDLIGATWTLVLGPERFTVVFAAAPDFAPVIETGAARPSSGWWTGTLRPRALL